MAGIYSLSDIEKARKTNHFSQAREGGIIELVMLEISSSTLWASVESHHYSYVTITIYWVGG